MTGEKEKAPVDDRALIQEKTQQVLDELAKVGGFSELVQKGLKSMTLKQFIAIIQLFMKPVVGKLVLDGSNYVDTVHNFLTSMDYPYSINKSSLKTPSAPHCQNNIVLLLAWFADFSVLETDVDKLINFYPTEDFVSAAASKRFMEKTAEAFVLWNNQQEADGVTDLIRQENIDSKLGKGVDIECELSRLKESIDDLKQEAKPVSVQQEFNEKKEAAKMLNKKVEDLAKAIDSLSSKAVNMRANLDIKQTAVADASLELNKLYKKLAKQNMTMEKRSQLLVEITQAKSVLASKKQAAQELNETCSEKEIQLSNLIQKKFLLIDKLNNLIYQLYSDLEIAGMCEKFDPAAYEIKTTRMRDTDSLNDEIDNLSRGLLELKEKYVNALSAVNSEVAKYDAKRHQLAMEQTMISAKLEKLKARYEELCGRESVQEREMLNNIHNMDQICQQNSIEIKELSDYIVRMEENILKFQEANAQIVVEQAAFKKNSLEQCRILKEKRKQEFEHHQKRLNTVKELVTEFNKRVKHFPPNVQATIESVLSQKHERREPDNLTVEWYKHFIEKDNFCLCVNYLWRMNKVYDEGSLVHFDMCSVVNNYVFKKYLRSWT